MQEFKDFKNEVFDQMVDSLDDLYQNYVILKHNKGGLNTKLLSIFKDGFIHERIFNANNDNVALHFQVPYESLDAYFKTMQDIYDEQQISYELSRITYNDNYTKCTYTLSVRYEE